MKHVVTITKEDFQLHEYSDNLECPLAQALKRHFPNASNVFVGVSYFQFDHPKLGFTRRNFEACEIEGMEYCVDRVLIDETELENAICEMSTWNSQFASDLTFNFITI